MGDEEAKSSPWRFSGNSIFIPNQPTKFEFDRIFREESWTGEVYESRTKDIVAAAVGDLMFGEVGPKTLHIPTGEKLSVFDAAVRYKEAGQDTIVLAGAEYGSGSSRDWAAKGPMLQGVKAVIAKSFERIHRSNLVGMGIIPLCFKAGEDADTLGLTSHERYTIDLPEKVSEIKPGQDITVKTDNGKSFTCTVRFDTQVELTYFDHGGILPYVIRNLIKK